MNPVIALALRRVMILSGAIGSALVAHTVVSGELLLTPLTPIWWGMLTCVAVLIGRRTAWRRRGFGATLVLLGVLQLSTHTLMGSAPWLFGLDVHHIGALISPTMLLAHFAALLLSAWLITRAEGIIDGAMAVASRLARALSPPPRRGAGRPLAFRLPAFLLPANRGPLVHGSRGPPVPASI